MDNKIQTLVIPSPIGPLQLQSSTTALTAIRFLNEEPDEQPQSFSPVLRDARQQLEEYFEGNRTEFNLLLQPTGSDFEQEVWSRIKEITFGSTTTYSALAKQLGDVNKVRAVGRANGQNPLPIVIPCHRVIGANDKLTGYAGGIERKQWLLRHEGAILL